MTAQNRVTPFGEIVAIGQRGAWTGNRGCLHDGRELKRRWVGRRWITCALEHRGWHHEQWERGTWTALFFLDEPVALAAGHRPCALCRRPAYDRFRAAWSEAFGSVESAEVMDRRLHADRLDGREQRHQQRQWHQVPPGAFVLVDGAPMRAAQDHLAFWTATGYGPPVPRPRTGNATVITPAATVEVLRAGFVPDLDLVASRCER